VQLLVVLQAVPVLVETTFLLFTLNEYLSRTAVMVQPLDLPPQAESIWDLDVIDVALPLSSSHCAASVQGNVPAT
jgi:hypothetical protein